MVAGLITELSAIHRELLCRKYAVLFLKEGVDILETVRLLDNILKRMPGYPLNKQSMLRVVRLIGVQLPVD